MPPQQLLRRPQKQRKQRCVFGLTQRVAHHHSVPFDTVTCTAHSEYSTWIPAVEVEEGRRLDQDTLQHIQLALGDPNDSLRPLVSHCRLSPVE